MSLAIAGHGASIAMELDPVGAAGVFTRIAEVNSDVEWPEFTRPETNVTIHEDDIDSYVLGVLERGQLTFSVNFVYNHGTHDHLTGLYKAMRDKAKRGFRLRGPGGTANTDEWIMSGQVQKISKMDPIREGVRTSEVAIRLSGVMKIDGVVIGTVS